MHLKAALVPALGVASAVALFGLVAAYRGRALPRSPARPKLDALRTRTIGSAARRAENPQMDGLLAPHAALPLAFWDSGPDSEERIGLGVGADADEAVDGDDGANPEEIAEAYAASAEWLARATETPPSDGDAFDLADDDPAEIAADSTSMISDASRLAAFGLEEQDEQDDPREDERD